MAKTKEVINLLLKMVFSLKFLGAVAATLMLYSQHSIEAMVGVVIAYLAVKSIINTSINLKEGEFEYHFVDDPKANSIICWFLSTKTWLAAICFFLILKAAGVALSFADMTLSLVQVSQGWLPLDQVAPNIEALGIAYGSAVGLPEIAGFIKGKVTVKPLPSPPPQPAQQAPVLPASQPPVSPEVYVQPPPKIEAPFSDKDKSLLLELAKVDARANLTTSSLHQGTVSPEPRTENIFYSALRYAQDVVRFPALNINRVRDGYSFLLQLGKQAYFEQAKHPFGEGHRHLSDYNPNCPYSTVKQMARDQGFEDTMNELIRLESNLDYIEWADSRGINLIARAPSNMQSIYMIGEIARELHQQAFNTLPVTPSGT